MTKENPQFDLSEDAFSELKQIIQGTLAEDLPDGEIRDIGLRLLQLFSMFSSESHFHSTARKKPTSNQFMALKYIHQSIYHDKKHPTVRGIAEAIGLRSSRSGLRMLNELMNQGFVFHDNAGDLRMREDVAGCDTRITHGSEQI